MGLKLLKIQQCFYLKKGDDHVINEKGNGKTDGLVFIKPGENCDDQSIKEQLSKID